MPYRSFARVRIVVAAVLCLFASGCDRRSAAEQELGQVNAQLTRVLEQLTARQAPTDTEIRAVFQPFQEAVETLAKQAERDRERWTGLAGEVRALAAVVEGNLAGADRAPLTDLRSRLDGMEAQLKKQRMENAADRALMIRALDGSSRRLDALLQSLVKPPAGTKPAGATPAPGGAKKSAKSEPPSNGSLLDSVDVTQALVIFLAISLLGLVAVVVFFPGRLRSSVPNVEFEAQPVSVPGHGQAPAVQVTATDASGLAAHAIDIPSPLPDAPRGEGPVPHELALQLEDPATVEGLVEILDTYLHTEPYILQTPAPRVAWAEGELHLHFYALPNLSKAEHALLDATVRRLRPRAVSA